MAAGSFSTDDKHRATLAVLQEALDYLKRLPAVPVTRDMCKRIQEHLDEPTNRLLDHTTDVRSATAYTAVGYPWIAFKLQGDHLNVRLLPKPKAVPLQKQVAMILKNLSGEGFDIGLVREAFGEEKCRREGVSNGA